jgi:hypothetical protein
MEISRRNVLKMGVAMSAVPLVGPVHASPTGERVFLTGSPDLDRALGGGIRLGTLSAVIGPRGSGKTDFLFRLAKANGVGDAYTMNVGGSDMLSIMEREDGQFIGSLIINGPEPATDKERADMERDPKLRSAFLNRWFTRTRDVLHDSGGIMIISVRESPADAAGEPWLKIPDYVISVTHSGCALVTAR